MVKQMKAIQATVGEPRPVNSQQDEGVLCVCEALNISTEEYRKQFLDGFREEFGVDITLVGEYKTLPGHGGEGGRSDVVFLLPSSVIGKAAIHPFHLNGMFRWADDYLEGNRDIVPPEALRLFASPSTEAEREAAGPPPFEQEKPKCKLTGTDGNVFALAGVVSRCLKKAGQREKAGEFQKRLFSCESYDKALQLMMEYVEVS